MHKDAGGNFVSACRLADTYLLSPHSPLQAAVANRRLPWHDYNVLTLPSECEALLIDS